MSRPRSFMLCPTIVSDPAWSYRDKINAAIAAKVASIDYGAEKIRGRRGAAGYYPTMTLTEIGEAFHRACNEALVRVPANAHLYLWTTNAFIEEAHKIARRWGFWPRTVLTWVKPGIGVGHYYRNNTEHVIFAVRGTLKTRRADMPTAFTAPRGQHSEKPARFYEIVESMSPGGYFEMFSRRTRPGWRQWGNQLGKLDRAS